MIHVSGLSKSYGHVEALRDVSFSVEAGEIIGLLGPNGAGKTTLMKILTGYLQPTSGQAIVDGLDVLKQSLEVQRRIGYLPETAPLYPELSVQAYLKMIAELREIPADLQPALLADTVRSTGLQEHLTRPIGQLSKGYRQRVGLAQAIMHKPKLLILDEPTIGLDPTQVAQVRHLVRRLAEGSTILLSTHILSEVEAICDRVIILLNGEIRANDRLADLEASPNVILVLAEEQPNAMASLQALEGAASVKRVTVPSGVAYQIMSTGRRDLRPSIYDLARDSGWPLVELRQEIRTLETVFNELATSSTRRDPESTDAGGDAE